MFRAKLKYSIAGFFIMVSSVMPVFAAAENQSDAEPSFSEIKGKADKGEPYFQGVLSEYYRRGSSEVPRNYVEALKYAKLSAEKENPFGYYNMAILYEEGVGVAKDVSLADKYFGKAFDGLLKLAKDADPKAQYNIGYMYITGNGVQKDQMEGFYWMRKAAGRGNVPAQYTLGYMYFHGYWGAIKDFSKAFSWLTLASDNGDARAMYLLSLIYMNGSGVEKNNAKALELLNKAADQEEPNALFALGSIYEQGKGVEQNPETAKKYYERSAAAGFLKAKERLKGL